MLIVDSAAIMYHTILCCTVLYCSYCIIYNYPLETIKVCVCVSVGRCVCVYV